MLLPEKHERAKQDEGQGRSGECRSKQTPPPACGRLLYGKVLCVVKTSGLVVGAAAGHYDCNRLNSVAARGDAGSRDHGAWWGWVLQARRRGTGRRVKKGWEGRVYMSGWLLA